MLLGKVNPKHVFIFKVAELLNSYIQDSPPIGNPQHSQESEVEIFIANLFDNQYGGTYPEFIEKIDEIAKRVFAKKVKSIAEQGSSFYADLKKVFTKNIDNLLKTTPDGFRLLCGGFVTTLFESDKDGNYKTFSRDLLPSSAKYIREINKGKAILADLTSSKWEELRSKGTLFVAHDKDTNFIVVERKRKKNYLVTSLKAIITRKATNTKVECSTT